MSPSSASEILGDEQWVVTLVGGNTVRVRAQAYTRQGGSVIFSGLESGRPPSIVDVAWIPEEIVEKVRGPVPFEEQNE